MQGSRIANWLFWPESPAPWVCALVLLAILTALAPKLPGIPDLLANLPRNPFVVGLVAALNLALLWLKLAPGYLTARTARKPWLFTFVALSLMYLAVATAFHKPGDPAAWFAERMAFSQAGVAAAIAAGWAFGLLPSMTALKTDRATATRLLGALCAPPHQRWSTADRDALDGALKRLKESGSSSSSPRASADVALLGRWQKAAAEAAASIRSVDSLLVDWTALVNPLNTLQTDE